VRHVALGNLQGKGHSPEGGHDKATGSTPNRQERRTPVTWDQFGSNVTEPETARLLMAMAMINPPNRIARRVVLRPQPRYRSR
jgi:hypothetical protein